MEFLKCLILKVQSMKDTNINGGEFSKGVLTLQDGITQYYSSGSDIVYGTTGHDTLYGEGDNDFIAGRAGNDMLYGGDGNDTLVGGYGNDMLYGGNGDDTLVAGLNSDILDGGSGNDTASFGDATSAVTANLSTGIATHGSDTDTLVNIENISGSHFNDTLIGDSHNNVITGGQGNDILTGGDGIDTFTWKADDLVGGHYTDIIKDFSISATAGDKLDLSDVLDAGDSYSITQDPNNAANATLTVTKAGASTPEMTIILENHGGDALDDLQAYLSHDENLIK